MTLKFDPNSEMDSSSSQSHQNPTKTHHSNPFSLLFHPFQWLQSLSRHLNPTFIAGIFVVYGLSQGFSGSFFRVVSDYYWKDVQKIQPSLVQIYVGFYYIPWIMKPIWGLLTDVFPVMGYRRRPYFVAAGVIGGVSAVAVAVIGDMAAGVALGCMVGVTGAMAVADVTIDACIAKNSIEVRWLAADMQSLCGLCSSVGALLGFATSGFFVHRLGAQGALGVLAMPPASILVLGFIIYELKITSDTKSSNKKVIERVRSAMESMYGTIKCPQVWKPTLYMYLSLALSFSTHEGHFYWYTDPKAGPGFSQEFVGIIYAVGALASILGVLIYHNFLKDIPFRTLLFSAQFVYAISGMLDLFFVLRWNLMLGIPDPFFVILEESILRITTRVRWIPMIVLSTRLCPLGIEGTFFALLMCIDSLGSLSSKMVGGMVLHMFHVSRTDFANLWVAVLIRNGLRFATLAFVFLVPNVGHYDVLLPPDLLSKSSCSNKGLGEEEEEATLELLPLNERSRLVGVAVKASHSQV